MQIWVETFNYWPWREQGPNLNLELNLPVPVQAEEGQGLRSNHSRQKDSSTLNVSVNPSLHTVLITWPHILSRYTAYLYLYL